MTDVAAQVPEGGGVINSALDGSLLLRPVRGGNAYEETVERLLQTIRLGLVAPGDRLAAERELALMLDVSRDTVRDAIQALVDARFLEVRRGRYGGAFVTDPVPTGMTRLGRTGVETAPAAFTADDIRDVLVVREILEVGAAQHAAERPLSSAERDALWTALSESKNSSGDDYRRLDSRLHLLIAELAGSPSLLNHVAQCRMRINELLDGIPLLSPNISHSDEQHERIVLAILTGDSHVAAEEMRAHLAGSAALLRGFLG
jgi:DNA-binding FadR family transcriptional regulator